MAQSAPCTAVPPASLDRANCEAQIHQWEKAEEAYRAYLNAHPDSLVAAIGHADVLLQLVQASLLRHDVANAVKRAMEASSEVSDLLAAHPNEPAVLKLHASVLSNVEKNPAVAEQVLVKITKIAPQDGLSWSLLGSFYLDSKRNEEGIRCFERAVALDPANALYRAALARGYAAAGRDTDAEHAFASALDKVRPDTNPLVFLWYGDFLASAQRYDESRQAYSRAIEADPANGDGWLKRASVEVKSANLQDAEKDAKEALQRGAAEREVQLVLISVYRSLGENSKARAAAAAVAQASDAEEERRAKWRDAKSALEEADRLMRANRFAEALPLYRKVTAEVPAYADAWFSAGICHSQTGDAKQAEQSLRAFLRLQPLSAEGHSALGLVLLSEHRGPEARAEFEEALRLNPASAEARAALATLGTPAQ